ncbi:LLM class flavin-dependent oxidoreductase [Pedobacter sp. UBA5917]|jgi:luciferase family oxidoreductase group 1|uniref:LLM class flavin-dependent oxidoreductase n=1 Tax=Pedobacter sp. UBA5917 TaxID=1947061 RepID=UPI0025CF6A71|nr:LLM class flavin-dependent oxidoreductase [Pedobacter sp. UBA5917]
MKIGLLEFGAGPPEVKWMLENVVDYACKADELGFSRIWLGEHYFLNHFWYNPEILIPVLAGMTDRIKIGVAGILLGIHSPYRVALTFKMLATLFPGRIDLGIANGTPSQKVVKLMLQKSDEECLNFRDDFGQKFSDLVRYLREEEKLWEEQVLIPPHGGGIPDIWSLGLSYNSLGKTLPLGVNFSRSIFHLGSDRNYNREKLHEFQEEFFALHGRMPEVNVTFAGICAKTSQYAQKLLNKMGKEEESNLSTLIVGCPNKFHDTLMAMQEDYGVDEFIMLNLIYNAKDKINSIELISEKCFEGVYA